MNPRKTKSIWVAGAAVAGVVAIGTTVFVLADPDTGNSHQDRAQAIPRPSGPIPDYPDQAPEYDAEDCEYSELESDSETGPAVSPSGEYIASSDASHALLLNPDGETLNIGETVKQEIDGLKRSYPTAVNSRGMVVGNDGRPNHGWVYYDDDVVELPLPDSVDVSDSSRVEINPTDLNEDGDIVGYVTVKSTKNNRSDTKHLPLRWDAGANEATVLEAGDDGASASFITEDGTVIGAEFDDRDWYGGAPTDAYGEVWKWDRDGQRDTLPLPGRVVDVAGDWLLSTDRDQQSYRWNMADGGDVEEVSLGDTIDTSGRVFGERDDRAVIETDAGVEELPVPADERDDVSYLVSAVGANSGIVAGKRVVDGHTANFKSTDVMWRCADS